jgi:hypothetical protein
VPEIPVIVVNPGQRISIVSEILASKVNFAYLPPGATERVEDPGLGRPGSRIKRLGDRTVWVAVDTRGMLPGEGWWILTGEDEEDPELQVSEPGRFVIREVPRVLLGLSAEELKADESRPSFMGSRFDMLGSALQGRPGGGQHRSKSKSWEIAGAVAAGVLIGALITL